MKSGQRGVRTRELTNSHNPQSANPPIRAVLCYWSARGRTQFSGPKGQQQRASNRLGRFQA
eukprot:11918262-Alexandrium_andersonii.AAC.1